MANIALPTNKSVQDYRAWLEGQSGRRDRREDIELTLELGNLMRARNDSSLEESDVEFRSQFLEASQATDRGLIGEAAAGVKRGWAGLKSTAVGAAALGLDLIGADETAQSVARTAKEIEETAGDNAPTVQKFGDVHDVGSAVRYGLGKVGEAAPSIAEAIGTGMIGAGIGSAATPAGTVVGGVAGLIERQAVKRLVKKGVTELTEKAVKAEAAALTKMLGAAAVGGANSWALSSGEIYNDTGNVPLALGAGAVAAIPDTVLPTYVLGKFFKGPVSDAAKKDAASFLATMGKEAAKTMPFEATTEAFQELVGIAAKKYNAGEPATLTKADLEQLIEAGIGGLAGGFIAAPLAAAGERRGTEDGGQRTEDGGQRTEDGGQGTADPRTAARKAAAAAASGEELPVAAPVKTRGENVRDLTKLAPEAQDARIEVLQAVAKRTPAEEGELDVLQALVGQRPPEVAKTAPSAPPVVAPTAETKPTETAATIAPAAAPVETTAPTTTLVTPSAPAPAVEEKPVDVLADLTARTKQAIAEIGRLGSTVQSLDISTAVTQLKALADAGTATSPRAQALATLEGTLAELRAQVPVEAAKLGVKKVEVVEAKAKNDMARLAARAAKEAERALDIAEKAAKKLNAPYGDLPDKPVQLGVRGASGEVTPWEAPARKAALIVGAQIDKLNTVLGKLAADPLSKALKKQVKPDVAKFFEAEQAKLVTQGVEAKQASRMVIETAIAEADAHLTEIYKQAGVERVMPPAPVVAPAETAAVAPVAAPAIDQRASYSAYSPEILAEKAKNGDTLAQQMIAQAAPVVAPTAAPVAPVAAPTAPLAPIDAAAMGKALAETAAAPLPPAPARTKGFKFGKITLESKAVSDAASINMTDAMTKGSGKGQTRAALALLAPNGKVVLRGVADYTAGTLRVGPEKVKAKGLGLQGMGRLKGKVSKSKVIDYSGNQPALLDDVLAGGFKLLYEIHFANKGAGFIDEEFSGLDDFNAALGISMKDAAPIGAERKAVRATKEARVMAGMEDGNLAKEQQLVTDAALLQARINNKDFKVGEELDQAKADVASLIARAGTLDKVNQKDGGTVKNRITNLPTVEKQVINAETGGEADPAVAAGAVDTDLNAEKSVPGALDVSQVAAMDDTPGGKLGAFFDANEDVRVELVSRMRKHSSALTIPGNAMPLLLSYLKRTVATPLGLDPADVVNHLVAAWKSAKLGVKTDLEQFEYGLTKADPMAIDSDPDDAGVMHSRDGNLSVPESAQARAQFDQMVNTLRNQGHDIELLKKTFIGEGGQDAWIDGDGKISLVMNDTMAGNLINVAAVAHEVGHDLIGEMSEARKAALMRATNATIATVRKGELLAAASNANTNTEEKLVDAMAIKLAEEGFGAQSATLAETIWRTVKDLYYRMANAMITSLGGAPSDTFVTSWFENSLRRKLGGDYDFRFASLLAPFTESRARSSERFERIGGAPVADFLNPLTNTIEQGMMLPDSIEAADWNVMHAPRDFRVDDPDNAKVNLAPNGKPSKLSNRQWNMVRTPAFKAWFGDWQNDPANASKAIDPETGEPLVVYHGTSARTVDWTFNPKRMLAEIGSRRARYDLVDQETGVILVKQGERFTEQSLKQVFNGGNDEVAVSIDPYSDDSGEHNMVRFAETKAVDFDEFDRSKLNPDSIKGAGVYTTASPLVAGGDGKSDGYNAKGSDGGLAGRVLPLFISIRNPMVDEPANKHRIIKGVTDFLESLAVQVDDRGVEYRSFVNENGAEVSVNNDEIEALIEADDNAGNSIYKEIGLSIESNSTITEIFRKMGYDGVQHTGGLSRRHGDGVPHQVYVAFDPAQVKSTLNLGTFNPADPRIQYRKDGTPTSPTESDLNYTEASSRITSAAWNEIIPIITELKAALGKNFTDEQFWARFANGDLPRNILDKMESRAPGSSTAKISDAAMTDPMVQRARYQAYKIAETMARRALGKAAKLTEHADKAGLDLIDQAKKLNKIERESRDASAVNAHFNEKLRNDLKELVRDLDRGYNLSEAAGKLMGAIRVEESLTDDQAIPEEYSRVFKTILDSDGTTSLFDKLEAISKLDLPLGSMNVEAVIAAIKENAPKDANLGKLVANRPLLVALASLARNSTREMDLLQLRTLKDTTQFLAIKAQLEEIRTANDERLDQLAKDFKTGQKNQGLSERLRGEFLKARREFRTTQRTIQRSEETAAINRQVAAKMEAKATELSKDVGAFSSWVAHDGATYQAMQPNEDGSKWKAVTRTLRMVGDDVGAQREQIRHDLALNHLWLEGHADQRGSRLYQEVERQTHELGVTGIGEKEYRAANRFRIDKLLQPLGQKFASTGRAAGALIQQMLNRWQFVTKTHADDIEAKSRKWTHAFEEARNAAGYTGARARQFIQEIYTPVIYAIESQPGMDEAAALREAVRAAKRRIPEGFVVTDAFAEKLGNLMRATKTISEKLNGIAEEQGVYIADKRLKDPLTAKENLNRHAIKYGWLTSTRKLDANVIRTLVKNMTAVGWSKGMFDEIAPAEMNDAQWRELIDTHFTPIVKRTFVDPFTGKPGKEVFFGAKEANGDNAYISQLMARNEWENAGGDVLAFIDNLFDKTNQADDRKGLGEYRKAMLKRFAFLYEMESTLAAKTDLTKDVSNPTGPKSHRIMDGRTNDLIPPEHFTYDAFDPTSARIALAEIAYHAAFGRDGTGLDKAVATLKTDLDHDAESYRGLKGSEKIKREKAAAAGLDYKKIERAYKDARNVDGWMGEVVAYFGGTNPSGATGDAKTALELLQLNTQLILNQPKSGLWNILSLADFPIAFRGINKSSLTATGFASRALAKNVFGSLLETMGVQVLRASEYAKEIGQVFEHRQTERLPYGVFMADIGKGGSFEDTKGDRVTQGIRAVQQTMRKGVKVGVKGEGEFAGNNALWAPFNYINTQVASAIATANVQTFEIMMKKAVAYFAQHPEAHGNAAFTFTAETLGMKGNAFFSDEGAFDFYRRAALEYRMGSLEDMARGAAGRMAKGERILTRDQVLAIAMIANNELSLESGINSRPSEMFNNPVLRFGGMLMGWPLAKMNQVNQSLKTSDGRLEAQSVLKGLGVMAAWSLPMGLAYSLLMDRYDDDILNKKSNLRAIDPIAAVPIVGPALALAGAGDRSGTSNALGMLERMAKAGSYGLMGDFVNSFANWTDPSSGQRDFDLNSRVVAYSQYANIRDTVRNLIHQDGAVTYGSVIRPFITSLGGNGVIQYQQILNNALELNNAEAEMTNRINVRSYIRAAAREAGISLKAGGARTSPTPTSVWVREMELNALSNDRLGFLEAYRNAVDAARKAGEAEPEAKILEAWKARGPIKSVTAHVPSETEMGKLNAALGEDGRRVVREAEGLFARYTESIAPSPFEVMMQRQAKAQQRAMDPAYQMKLRSAAAQRAMGY